MNCCDYNCHQGKNCPVRATPLPAPTVDERPTLRECLTVAAAIGLLLLAFGWVGNADYEDAIARERNSSAALTNAFQAGLRAAQHSCGAGVQL